MSVEQVIKELCDEGIDWEVFFTLKILDEKGPLTLEDLVEELVRRGYIGWMGRLYPSGVVKDE